MIVNDPSALVNLWRRRWRRKLRLLDKPLIEAIANFMVVPAIGWELDESLLPENEATFAATPPLPSSACDFTPAPSEAPRKPNMEENL